MLWTSKNKKLGNSTKLNENTEKAKNAILFDLI